MQMRSFRIKPRYSIASILLLTAVIAVGLQLTLPKRSLIGTWASIDDRTYPKGLTFRFDGEFVHSNDGSSAPYKLSTSDGQRFIDLYGEYGNAEHRLHCSYSLEGDLLLIQALDPPDRRIRWKLKRVE